MSVMTSLRAAFVALAALSLTACGINSVPAKEEVAKAKWADVQNAYQRRADLIPNLVSTVRGAAASESQILTNVTDARARATSINITTDDLSNPEEFQEIPGRAEPADPGARPACARWSRTIRRCRARRASPT
jgi:LemA protein